MWEGEVQLFKGLFKESLVMSFDEFFKDCFAIVFMAIYNFFKLVNKLKEWICDG